MHAWKQLRGELRTASGRNFERLVLPLLQLFWPNALRPPDRDELDRAGIDIAADVDNIPLSVVVQCKGFYSSETLDRGNYRQIRDSIDQFIASPFSCQDYVLLHNQDSRDAGLTEAIQADLGRIREAGKARRTRLWDRQTFVRDLQRRLREHLALQMYEQSAAMLKGMSSLFHFGDVYLPVVPVSEQRLLLRRGMLPVLEVVSATKGREPAKLISAPAQVRWTLLMGLFGSGKSSAALHAAVSGRRLVIFARCAELHLRHGGVGTNILMETIVDSLNLFEDFDDEARRRLGRLSGTLLRALLVDDNNELMLILDGLDENRAYSTPRGVMTLSSVLSELRCPILLTTREEHFNATFANYEGLLADHSTKGGARREARVLKLEPWDDAQVSEFLARVLAGVQTPREELLDLKNQVDGGSLPSFQKELLRHPLFLQMMTDLAAEGEDWSGNAAALLKRWTAFKLWRDLEVDRPLPAEIHDRLDYLERIERAMEDVAGSMVDQSAGEIALTETVPSEIAVGAVARAFGTAAQDVTTATAASLLVPAAPSRDARRRLKFSHRAFQEFFLARYLAREQLDVSAYPNSVQALCRDLRRLDP